MVGVSRSAWFIVALVSSLSIPVASSAGPQEKLQETERQLDRVRQDIDAKKGRADELKSRVDELSNDLTSLQIQITKLDAEVERINSEVRDARTGIARTRKQIDEVRDVATAQAVALYKSGGVQVVDALLGSKSITELNDRIEFLGVAARKNTGALVRYHRLRVAIASQHRELFEKKRKLSSRLAERSKLHAKMKDRRARLAADLQKLNGKLRHLHEREGNLEVAALRLTGDIQSAQARESVERLGESAQGFIWPLNGGVNSYYGTRWGRMHTGIDIDGYTSQPIIASRDGRVMLASYYSGYGNSVILDHGGGVSTLYAHMSGFAVSSGQQVSQGKVVGYVGCTGSCTGDHLHFEVRINGHPEDPLKYLP